MYQAIRPQYNEGEFGRIFLSEAFEIHRYPQSSPLLSTS